MKITDFRNARIIDMAERGATISGIAKETKIPFASVYRIIRTFENMGFIKTDKIGKKVIVRIKKRNDPVIKSMIENAKWIYNVIWNPDTEVARIFENKNIDYAFIGTTKIKYTKQESRNMVQVAVKEQQFHRAKKIVNSYFKEIGIKTTENAHDIIGNAMSIIYFKCFPVKKVRAINYYVKGNQGDDGMKVRIADDVTEKEAMKYATDKDFMFIPAATNT